MRLRHGTPSDAALVRRAAATAVLLLGTLTGCSLDGPARSAPVEVEPPTPTAPPVATPTDPSTSAPTPAVEPEEGGAWGAQAARTTHRRALRALALDGTGRFSTSWSVEKDNDTSFVESKGSYDIPRLRADFKLAMGDTASGVVKMRAKATRHDSWYSITKVADDRPDRCWIHQDPELLAEMAGVELADTAGFGFPSAVGAIFTARATRFVTTQDLEATADLYSVAAAFIGQMPDRLGIPYESRDRVPIRVRLHDGGITGWTAELMDVVAVAEDAGYLPKPIRRLLDSGHSSEYDATLEVDLTKPGKRWLFEPPAPSEVVEMTEDMDSLDDDLRLCTGWGAATA